MANVLAQLLKEARENQNIALIYASKKCKQCNGRGHKLISIPNQFTGEWIENTELCDCVIKAIKKELKKSG